MSKLKQFLIQMRKQYYRGYYKSYIGDADVHINGKCRFNSKMELGNNVHFNGFHVKGNGAVKIGNNFHSGVNVKLITTYHNYESTRLPYDNTLIHKDITIGDQVWIGDDVIILGGVTIGDGAIIQAGSVVSSSIPSLGIAGGNPARVFKERNAEHYNELVKNSKFF